MSDKYRQATAGAVLLVAVIAATVSFMHIAGLALAYGQPLMAAYLLPVSVDGVVATSSLVLLRSARAGLSAPWLARTGLVLAVAATLAANVASGLPHGWPGAVLAGWPAVAFVVSAETAISMSRKAARKATPRAIHGAIPAATSGPPAKAARKPPRAGAKAATEAAQKAITGGQPAPSARSLAREFKISRDTAGKVLAGFNGHAGG